jgi:hypothetical protein
MNDILSLSPSDTVCGLLELARREVALGDKQFRQAAQHMASAEEKGASQRQIAKAVGRSVGWVNRILQWKRAGYHDETPFGPQSRASRARGRVHPTERQTESRSSDAARNRLHSASRQRLIRLLGMLGSNNANERTNAAVKVEALRSKLKMGWDELIVPTNDTESEDDDANKDPIEERAEAEDDRRVVPKETC